MLWHDMLRWLICIQVHALVAELQGPRVSTTAQQDADQS